MAIVAVTADNTRLEDAESGTGWNNIGGGAGGAAEGSFPYQGNNLYNRKVTGNSGFYYDPTADAGSAISMIPLANSTWMVKAIVSDYAGLNAVSGLRVRIGSATTAFHQFVISGTNAKIPSLAQYPARGGLIIIPINPNIAAFRDATTGSPTLSAVDYFGLEANFDSSTAKSENVGLDAIDLGRGLTLTGGDGADPDATWQDFVNADEGTNANRWGFASSTFDEVKLFYGQMRIGNLGGTATVFNDTTSQILWLDGLFDVGWSTVDVRLNNAANVITDGATHTGLGSAAVSDTRPHYAVSGTTGSFVFNGTLNNFGSVSLNSACTVENAFIETETLAQDSAIITNSTIRTTAISGQATITPPNFATMDNVTFEQGNAGHAIWIFTPGTYTLDALTFSGYGADGTNSAAIYNNSGGLVTLNIINGGDTPTVRNGAGATTVVNNTVTVGVTILDANTLAPIQNARVLIEAAAGGALSQGDDILVGLTDASGRIEDTGFSFNGNQPIVGRARKATGSPFYKTGAITGTITSAGFDSNILLISDE